MDFGTLLSVAQRNETAKQTVACYQTKFAPPKKQTKQSKALSENIKKFLARKEEEERQKALEERRKKENLLALRDHKAQSRINKHLKVCKSANKAVLADAIDNENTAITIAGPSQPDEDDYGYVSQEASALYNQLMNKYNSLPPEKPLFSNSGKKTAKDIASTKDRVKQALKQQEIEEASGHRRKRKSSAVSGKTAEEEEKEDVEKVSTKEYEKEEKPKPKRKPPPPPMDFSELLKLAEKKQHEPVVIETKPKIPEPERLMTKKQMKEYMKEKEWRERKEQREKNTDNKTSEIKKSSSSDVKQTDLNKSGKPVAMKIPKTNGHISANPVPNKSSSKPTTNVSSSSSSSSSKKPNEKLVERSNTVDRNIPSKISVKDELLEERKKLEAEKRKLEEMRRAIEEEKKKLEQSKNRQDEVAKFQSKSSTNKPISKAKVADKTLPTKDAKPKQLPPADVKPRQFPPADVKPRQFPPADVKKSGNDRPKQFPPSDLRPLKSKPSMGKDSRKPHPNKRRIYDDDEDEYDSELDDFIDDGPEEESEDYSKYISEIFGYDKSKYRQEDDDDDAAMESNFAQQLKEEYVSTKIGIMEDLEDIRMEAMEKKRKAMLKKKPRK